MRRYVHGIALLLCGVVHLAAAAEPGSGHAMPQAPSDITTAEVGYRLQPGMRIALEVVHRGEY